MFHLSRGFVKKSVLFFGPNLNEILSTEPCVSKLGAQRAEAGGNKKRPLLRSYCALSSASSLFRRFLSAQSAGVQWSLNSIIHSAFSIFSILSLMLLLAITFSSFLLLRCSLFLIIIYHILAVLSIVFLKKIKNIFLVSLG